MKTEITQIEALMMKTCDKWTRLQLWSVWTFIYQLHQVHLGMFLNVYTVCMYCADLRASVWDCLSPRSPVWAAGWSLHGRGFAPARCSAIFPWASYNLPLHLCQRKTQSICETGQIHATEHIKHIWRCVYLATCEQASTRTPSKSLVNSGPFFLLFWITSLARYRNVNFLLLLAE